MASYIHRVIGPDEKLVMAVRLHWIYLIKGVVGFTFCMILAWVINNAIGYSLSLIYRTTTPASVYPLIATGHYLYQIMFVGGLLIFSFYLAKYIGTELGLTTRRMILKEGVIFTTTHEVGIEEILGERMDLGWFGRILDYAYVTLDCRFIEDVKTPAIEGPEHFIRTLHKLRSKTSDSVASVATHAEKNLDSEPPAQQQMTPAQQAAALDPKVVAEIVHQAMPQIVEEMEAQGLVIKKDGHTDHKPAEGQHHPSAEELLQAFDEASDDHPHGKKPGSLH